MGQICPKSKKAGWAFSIIFVFTLLNIIGLFINSLRLNGDAQNGYVKDGHHFVCAHGQCHEVNAAEWDFSRWQVIIAFGSVLLLVISSQFLMTSVKPAGREVRRNQMGDVDPKENARK